MAATFSTLHTNLRLRLNDSGSGLYSDDEIKYCLNVAYRETVQATKCYITSASLTLVNGTASYAITPIFEPLEVYVNSVRLEKATLQDLLNQDDDAVFSEVGTPTRWVPMDGANILLNPTPGPAMAGAPNSKVYGYAVGTAMSGNDDTAAVLPAGFDESALMDRAEAEARKMRATYANNAQIYPIMLEQWVRWVNQMRMDLDRK